MKLYDGGRVPNARRVRIFLAEKGMSIPLVPVDLAKNEHKTDAFRAKNPLGRVPVLELDDGTIITESVAICRYLEELQPDPPLFGATQLERARVEEWSRRVELELYIAIQDAFRHGHPAMAAWQNPQVPEWGAAMRDRAIDTMTFLDQELATRPFLAGENFSVADILGFISLEFVKPAKIAVPESLVHLRRWHSAIAARPSASA